MKEYVCIFSVKPAVRLRQKLGNLILRFPEREGFRKVAISKIQESYASDLVQTGLEFRTFIEANDLETARNEAKSLVDGIVSFMTLMSGVPIAIPQEGIIYEVTPSVKERDFLQVFYDPVKIPISRRNLNHDLLIEAMDRCLKSYPPHQQVIARAIRWYRLGCMTFDIFDKFSCFWIGLEALNPLLQDKLSVENDPTMCPRCRHKWVATPTISGIREFVKGQLPEKVKFYKRIRGLRVDIMHAKARLTGLRQEVSELAPILCELLFRAICFLVFDEKWQEVPFKQPLEYVPIRIELTGTLIGEDPNKLGPDGEDPHFEPTHTLLKLQRTEDDVSFVVTSLFNTCLEKNVKCTMREIRFYGDHEVKGKITDISVKRANERDDT